ncbi:unnamed protein product [Lactuca saligna]|uniref:Uncharacterized protein n=1 Tax=Lactuca saligna TaxID=75948 RepID=A0AA35Z1Z8_LACSI|nr:unnamed protein product [Lactuca saligna]
MTLFLLELHRCLLLDQILPPSISVPSVFQINVGLHNDHTSLILVCFLHDLTTNMEAQTSSEQPLSENEKVKLPIHTTNNILKSLHLLLFDARLVNRIIIRLLRQIVPLVHLDGEAYAYLLKVHAPEDCSPRILDTKDPAERENLFADNEDLQSEWKATKRSNRMKVVSFLKEKTGYSVSPDAMFANFLYFFLHLQICS